MSLFDAKVSLKDFNALKSGRGGTKVPPGDYELNANGEVRVLEASDKTKGMHVIFLPFQVTETNADADTHGANVQQALRYDPSPATEGREQMNEITLRTMAQLIDASGIEPTTSPDGQVDLFENLKTMFAVGFNVLATVSHDDKGYQEIGNFRPAIG